MIVTIVNLPNDKHVFLHVRSHKSRHPNRLHGKSAANADICYRNASSVLTDIPQNNRRIAWALGFVRSQRRPDAKLARTQALRNVRLTSTPVVPAKGPWVGSLSQTGALKSEPRVA